MVPLRSLSMIKYSHVNQRKKTLALYFTLSNDLDP
jgi:hypothetical protein